MNTSTLATLLSAVAIGGVGLLYLKVGQLSDDVRNMNRAPAGASRALAAGGEDDGSEWIPRPRRDSGVFEGSETTAGASASAGQAGRRARPTIEERLARVERRVQQTAAAPGAAKVPRWLGGRTRVFARSMDQLAKTLRLTPTQKVRVKTAVERGRERIEAILKIPDETGTSPYERRQERTKKFREAFKAGKPGRIFSFATSVGADRAKKIPGRNETYGQETDRIKKETREEIEGSLDTAQKKSLEQTNIDSLVGAPSEGMAISVFTSDTAGAPEESSPDQG